MSRKTSRRDFLRRTTLSGVGFWIGTSHLGAATKSPSEKLDIAVVGCGGKGASDTDGVAGETLVALCDVDDRRAAETFRKYPRPTKYRDFRRMLEREKIDAVVVSTPDHMHAPIAVHAMRMGKHVYVQKPLAHSVHEARLMREVARETGVATQMGNQGTARDDLRRAVEVTRAGAIGAVTEAHVWTNRPIWPQGIARPSRTDEVPSTLDWDLWLGVAPERPYVREVYNPFNWRGWLDFGTGALGDMACHTANMAFMALDLAHPTAIEASSSGINSETYPNRSTIVFDFPARGSMPPLKLTWYDGGNLPPKCYTCDHELPRSGSLLVGEKGVLFSAHDYGGAFKLLPENEFEGYEGPEPTLPRSPGHYVEWIQACKGGAPAMSNFDYAGLLTETILLGNVALRAGKRIEWDGPKLRVTNDPAANDLLQREYRKGWTV